MTARSPIITHNLLRANVGLGNIQHGQKAAFIRVDPLGLADLLLQHTEVFAAASQAWLISPVQILGVISDKAGVPVFASLHTNCVIQCLRSDSLYIRLMEVLFGRNFARRIIALSVKWSGMANNSSSDTQHHLHFFSEKTNFLLTEVAFSAGTFSQVLIFYH